MSEQEVLESVGKDVGGASRPTQPPATPPYPPATPPYPPTLSPHYFHPTSATGADFLHLIKYLEESRQHEEFRRREDEDARRQQDEIRRQEESARFTALLQLLSPVNSPPPTSGTPPEPTGAPTSTSLPSPQKAIAQSPPPLEQDASFQVFREWRRRWDDYAIMVDLSRLPREKQLIQMRMCLSLETQRILEHTLQVPPSTDKSVDEVLDALQLHIKSLRNEALRRREFLSCKQ